jgi:hypothetical protein
VAERDTVIILIWAKARMTMEPNSRRHGDSERSEIMHMYGAETLPILKINQHVRSYVSVMEAKRQSI